MSLHGSNFQLTKPTVTLNGSSVALGTTLRQVTEYLYQYVNEPVTTKPTTVAVSTQPTYVVHYTFGPQYPTHKVDNISCFKYTGSFTVTNNHGQDGTTINFVAFKKDGDGNAVPNDQSPVVVAKFKVHK
jgi:hypothetical protein